MVLSSHAKYTFYIGYFSEVTAEITIEIDDEVRATATHPGKGLGIDNWFHFSDHEYPGDEVEVYGDSIIEVLAEIGRELYPGAKVLLEDDMYGVQEPEKQFFTNLFFAFMFGEWYPASKRYLPEYRHPVGGRLTERFK